MVTKPGEKRPRFFRQYLVEKKPQYAYAAVITGLVLCIAVGMAIGFVVVRWQLSEICNGSSAGLCVITQMTGDVGREIFINYLFMIAPLAGFSFALGIVLSHRTFGPMVRFREHISELKAGNYSSRMKVRTKDHLTELATQLNELAEELEKRYAPKSP